MNVVQSFAAEDETQEIFEGLTDEHQRSFVDAVTYADMFGPVIDFCWGIGAMMLYLVGIRFLGFEKYRSDFWLHSELISICSGTRS